MKKVAFALLAVLFLAFGAVSCTTDQATAENEIYQVDRDEVERPGDQDATDREEVERPGDQGDQ